MNATELSQIVIDPEDRTTDLLLRLAPQADQQDRIWPLAKVLVGRFLHPFGVHTWVRWRHYDKASDQVLDMPGVVCQWCPKARYNR